MPTSKKRGGKKAHNSRIKKRNINIANTKRAYEKIYNNVLQAHLEKTNQEKNETSESEETPAN